MYRANVGFSQERLVLIQHTHVGTYGEHAYRMCALAKIHKDRLQRKTIKISFVCVHQVLIRGQLSGDSEASEVLAIDDLSFSPGCVTVPGTATINSISQETGQVQTLTFWNIATRKQTTTDLFWILITGEDIKVQDEIHKRITESLK